MLNQISPMRRFKRFTLVVFLLLASCVTEQSSIPAPACAPCHCAICPPPISSLTPESTEDIPLPRDPAEPEPPRGRLVKSDWTALPDWGRDDPAAALAAFVQSCLVIRTQIAWQDACKEADQTAKASIQSPENMTAFFQNVFEPYQVLNANETATGLVTGYYEPLLYGSRKRSKRYSFPIYAPPQDLLTIDLSEVYPDLKRRSLRGRLVGNKVVPYLERSDIESKQEPLRGLEILYVDNAVELFFLQIQGSGQVVLEDGSRVRVGYADQNGHPFRSLAGLLIRRGEIKPERASMQGIKEWAQRHPRKVQQYMNANPSFVFFKELPNDLSGPIGTLGVPLTAERSIAVDPRVIPLGVPVYLSTTAPNSKQELNRIMVAQDTGGAINGGVRADFYWGFGDAAGVQAGKMKQQGRMWVLLPRNYDPHAITASTLATQ